jgi:aminoglycoside phosphotransferase (APT) family kinase protein
LLLTPEGELGVLDWESAEPYGLPGVDLTYFLTYLVFFLDGAMKNRTYIDSYRRITDERSFTGQLWSTCQQLYIERTGLDPAALHPLRLLTWMIHSRSEARRLSEDGGGSPQPSALRHSLFYNLIVEELSKAPAGSSVH